MKLSEQEKAITEIKSKSWKPGIYFLYVEGKLIARCDDYKTACEIDDLIYSGSLVHAIRVIQLLPLSGHYKYPSHRWAIDKICEKLGRLN